MRVKAPKMQRIGGQKTGSIDDRTLLEQGSATDRAKWSAVELDTAASNVKRRSDFSGLRAKMLAGVKAQQKSKSQSRKNRSGKTFSSAKAKISGEQISKSCSEGGEVGVESHPICYNAKGSRLSVFDQNSLTIVPKSNSSITEAHSKQQQCSSDQQQSDQSKWPTESTDQTVRSVLSSVLGTVAGVDTNESETSDSNSEPKLNGADGMGMSMIDQTVLQLKAEGVEPSNQQCKGGDESSPTTAHTALKAVQQKWTPKRHRHGRPPQWERPSAMIPSTKVIKMYQVQVPSNQQYQQQSASSAKRYSTIDREVLRRQAKWHNSGHCRQLKRTWVGAGQVHASKQRREHQQTHEESWSQLQQAQHSNVPNLLQKNDSVRKAFGGQCERQEEGLLLPPPATAASSGPDGLSGNTLQELQNTCMQTGVSPTHAGTQGNQQRPTIVYAKSYLQAGIVVVVSDYDYEQQTVMQGAAMADGNHKPSNTNVEGITVTCTGAAKQRRKDYSELPQIITKTPKSRRTCHHTRLLQKRTPIKRMRLQVQRAQVTPEHLCSGGSGSSTDRNNGSNGAQEGHQQTRLSLVKQLQGTGPTSTRHPLDRVKLAPNRRPTTPVWRRDRSRSEPAKYSYCTPVSENEIQQWQSGSHQSRSHTRTTATNGQGTNRHQRLRCGSGVKSIHNNVANRVIGRMYAGKYSDADNELNNDEAMDQSELQAGPPTGAVGAAGSSRSNITPQETTFQRILRGGTIKLGPPTGAAGPNRRRSNSLPTWAPAAPSRYRCGPKLRAQWLQECADWHKYHNEPQEAPQPSCMTTYNKNTIILVKDWLKHVAFYPEDMLQIRLHEWKDRVRIWDNVMGELADELDAQLHMGCNTLAAARAEYSRVETEQIQVAQQKRDDVRLAWDDIKHYQAAHWDCKVFDIPPQVSKVLYQTMAPSESDPARPSCRDDNNELAGEDKPLFYIPLAGYRSGTAIWVEDWTTIQPAMNRPECEDIATRRAPPDLVTYNQLLSQEQELANQSWRNAHFDSSRHWQAMDWQIWRKRVENTTPALEPWFMDPTWRAIEHDDHVEFTQATAQTAHVFMMRAVQHTQEQPSTSAQPTSPITDSPKALQLPQRDRSAVTGEWMENWLQCSNVRSRADCELDPNSRDPEIQDSIRYWQAIDWQKQFDRRIKERIRRGEADQQIRPPMPGVTVSGEWVPDWYNYKPHFTRAESQAGLDRTRHLIWHCENHAMSQQRHKPFDPWKEGSQLNTQEFLLQHRQKQRLYQDSMDHWIAVDWHNKLEQALVDGLQDIQHQLRRRQYTEAPPPGYSAVTGLWTPDWSEGVEYAGQITAMNGVRHLQDKLQQTDNQVLDSVEREMAYAHKGHDPQDEVGFYEPRLQVQFLARMTNVAQINAWRKLHKDLLAKYVDSFRYWWAISYRMSKAIARTKSDPWAIKPPPQFVDQRLQAGQKKPVYPPTISKQEAQETIINLDEQLRQMDSDRQVDGTPKRQPLYTSICTPKEFTKHEQQEYILKRQRLKGEVEKAVAIVEYYETMEDHQCNMLQERQDQRTHPGQCMQRESDHSYNDVQMTSVNSTQSTTATSETAASYQYSPQFSAGSTEVDNHRAQVFTIRARYADTGSSNGRGSDPDSQSSPTEDTSEGSIDIELQEEGELTATEQEDSDEPRNDQFHTNKLDCAVNVFSDNLQNQASTSVTQRGGRPSSPTPPQVEQGVRKPNLPETIYEEAEDSDERYNQSPASDNRQSRRQVQVRSKRRHASRNQQRVPERHQSRSPTQHSTESRDSHRRVRSRQSSSSQETEREQDEDRQYNDSEQRSNDNYDDVPRHRSNRRGYRQSSKHRRVTHSQADSGSDYDYSSGETEQTRDDHDSQSRSTSESPTSQGFRSDTERNAEYVHYKTDRHRARHSRKRTHHRQKHSRTPKYEERRENRTHNRKPKMDAPKPVADDPEYSASYNHYRREIYAQMQQVDLVEEAWKTLSTHDAEKVSRVVAQIKGEEHEIYEKGVKNQVRFSQWASTLQTLASFRALNDDKLLAMVMYRFLGPKARTYFASMSWEEVTSFSKTVERMSPECDPPQTQTQLHIALNEFKRTPDDEPLNDYTARLTIVAGERFKGYKQHEQQNELAQIWFRGLSDRCKQYLIEAETPPNIREMTIKLMNKETAQIYADRAAAAQKAKEQAERDSREGSGNDEQVRGNRQANQRLANGQQQNRFQNNQPSNRNNRQRQRGRGRLQARNGRMDGNGEGNVTCKACGEWGHFADRCPQEQQTAQVNQLAQSIIICQICRGKGHTAHDHSTNDQISFCNNHSKSLDQTPQEPQVEEQTQQSSSYSATVHMMRQSADKVPNTTAREPPPSPTKFSGGRQPELDELFCKTCRRTGHLQFTVSCPKAVAKSQDAAQYTNEHSAQINRMTAIVEEDIIQLPQAQVSTAVTRHQQYVPGMDAHEVRVTEGHDGFLYFPEAPVTADQAYRQVMVANMKTRVLVDSGSGVSVMPLQALQYIAFRNNAVYKTEPYHLDIVTFADSNSPSATFKRIVFLPTEVGRRRQIIPFIIDERDTGAVDIVILGQNAWMLTGEAAPFADKIAAPRRNQTNEHTGEPLAGWQIPPVKHRQPSQVSGLSSDSRAEIERVTILQGATLLEATYYDKYTLQTPVLRTREMILRGRLAIVNGATIAVGETKNVMAMYQSRTGHFSEQEYRVLERTPDTDFKYTATWNEGAAFKVVPDLWHSPSGPVCSVIMSITNRTDQTIVYPPNYDAGILDTINEPNNPDMGERRPRMQAVLKRPEAQLCHHQHLQDTIETTTQPTQPPASSNPSTQTASPLKNREREARKWHSLQGSVQANDSEEQSADNVSGSFNKQKRLLKGQVQGAVNMIKPIKREPARQVQGSREGQKRTKVGNKQIKAQATKQPQPGIVLSMYPPNDLNFAPQESRSSTTLGVAATTPDLVITSETMGVCKQERIRQSREWVSTQPGHATEYEGDWKMWIEQYGSP